MWCLLLVILFNSLQVNGGLQFSNCVGNLNYQGIISYNATHNLALNSGWTYACYNGQCSTFPFAYSSFPVIDITFQCAGINQSIFCITTGSSLTGAYGGICGGILGDIPATNFQVLPNTECPNHKLC
ncbi:19355_t:CDS:1, partial [Gigaspora rosea]